MPNTILNDPSAVVNAAAYPSQARPDKGDVDAWVAGFNGSGVLSGAQVTAGSGSFFRGMTSTNSSNASVFTYSITVPAATQTGDFMVWQIACGTGSATATVPGWALLSTVASPYSNGTSGATRIQVWTRIAQPGDAGTPQTFTFGNQSTHADNMLVYAGIGSVDVFASQTGGPSSSIVAPSVGAVFGDIILSLFNCQFGTGSSTLGVPATMRVNNNPVFFGATGVSEIANWTGGSTTAQTATITGDSNASTVGMTVALKPGAALPNVAAGTFLLNGVQYTQAALTGVGIAAADPSYPRVDLIIWDSTVPGYRAITGTPAPVPSWPPWNPATQVLLAQVSVPAGATSISNSNIVDKRVMLSASSFTPVEKVNTVVTGGSSQTLLDVTAATIDYITLTANCVLTFPAAAVGRSFLLALTQGGAGSFTVTWPGTVKWAGGTAPTLTTTSGKTDVLSFVCIDGTNWLGTVNGQNF